MISLGFNAQGEVSTDKGRIDVVVYGRDWTAIVELKHGIKKPLNTLLKEAMKQIDDRKYYEGYMNKRVILIAISCSPKGLKCEMKEIES
jgi:hypothetical protein